MKRIANHFSSLKSQITVLSTAIACSLVSTSLAQTNSGRPIGQTTALIPEASTADSASEKIDGQSGDTAFAYGKFKALATIGEVNPTTGKVLTGYPDGNAAWLLDNDTIRVVYQSESYATMSSQTYGWVMNSGVKFTGSHIHTIDYNRAKFAEFLTSNTSASSMFEGSGNLFHTVYNVFGDVVVPRAQGGLWGNQALPNRTHVPFKAGKELTEGDFFFQSFCGSWYEPANKYGVGKGFADNVWLMAEEWNIGSQMFTGGAAAANDTMGLASMVVDIANQTAYTAPVLGQTGYEKIMPINPGNSNYVVAVLAGYNHDQNPVPNRIYIGVKGKNVNGTAINYATASQRDAFLARNGLLYGKIYGLALSNSTYTTLGFNATTINATTKMVDTYLINANATNTFSGRFYPTTYKWAGFDQPKAVKETEMMLWDDSNQQPAGYTFFNGDTKTEHPAVDPDITKFRYVQNMTASGALLGFDLSALVTELNNANGDLPAYVSANVTRIVPAINGALTLEVGGKGVAHPGTLNTSNKTASTHVEAGVAKMVAPDGLLWIKTDDGDFLIVDEDSGNDYGERKYVLQINEANMQLAEANKGYLLALAGGSLNPRALASAAAYNGTFTKATSAEFSGSWNVTGLVAKKQDGSFYTAQELAGTGEQAIISNIKLEKQTLIGVVQMPGESSGAVASGKADYGGQIFLFNMATLPVVALPPFINSASTANPSVGTAFTYTISASNKAKTFSSSTLPSWLTLNSTTGVLSGTPVASGILDIILTATNSAGTDTETLSIKVGAEASVFQTIKFLGGASLPTGGEIVDYANGKVLTTNSGNGTHKVEILTISSSGAFTGNSTSVDLSSVFGGAANINSVSSVLADQRGFGVATVIPTGTGQADLGKIAIFNIESGAILKTLDVGYHPDSVTITPNGTKLVVVNEGEYGSTNSTIAESVSRPGSISIVDISSVSSAALAANLTQSKVTTIDFSSANLATGVSIAGLRNARLDTLTTKTANLADIEPEYATATNTKAYITLQENNAIAVFDFATSKYSAIFELGTIEQLIDASDRDGANSTTSIAINDSVHGLPMPDTIANFSRSGSVFLMTANEGDARPDDADIARGSTLTANMTSAVAATATNTGIGRLNLLRFEGDDNNDGKIELPTMMGTRSFTIWNSSNGSLVYDSGSTLEMFAAANDFETFNTNSGSLSNTDTRSDDKGPEPEAIAYASLGGRDYAFVGCERQNGIYAFDITDLSMVKVVGYFNTISSTQDSGAAYISPESIKFIPAASNPSGKNLLLVGYEGTGSNGSVAVFEFAPVGVSSTPTPTPTLAQRSVASATTREEVKAIVSSKVQEALAKDPVKVKTTGQIAEILGVSKGTLSKIAKLAPSLKTEGGKINIAKLEKLIRNNPKAAALLTGNAKIQGGSKKSSVKK